jgi:hypothetical protein
MGQNEIVATENWGAESIILHLRYCGKWSDEMHRHTSIKDFAKQKIFSL